MSIASYSVEESAQSEEALDLLRLHLATLYQFELGARLLRHFGSARAVFRQPSSRLRACAGVSASLVSKLTSAAIGRRAEEEADRLEREGVSLLSCAAGAESAPPGDCAGPPILFARGRMAADGQPSVGVVGSRRPTQYGLRQTRRFAASLARDDILVVSGLARGVDGESHRAALDEGGPTVAVLGSGLGRVYPPEHQRLAERICESGRGMVLTPFPHDAAPKSFHFPLRNSVLSGLSWLLLVVEAGERSGSLITVDHALRQGKSVYAVPGRVDEDACRGCLRLLRDGAGLALEPADLWVALLAEGRDLPVGLRRVLAQRVVAAGGDGAGTAAAALDGPLSSALTALFQEEDTWHPDTIARRLGIDPCVLLRELTRLELSGSLRRLPGGRFVRPLA